MIHIILHHLHYNFNPIIVLFLTFEKTLQNQDDNYFNPIIVLFLTYKVYYVLMNDYEFQSYYSLISNIFDFEQFNMIAEISILL